MMGGREKSRRIQDVTSWERWQITAVGQRSVPRKGQLKLLVTVSHNVVPPRESRSGDRQGSFAVESKTPTEQLAKSHPDRKSVV